MKAFGMTLEAVEPGRVVIGFPISEAVTQQNGYLHAGVSAAAMDSACGFAGISLIPKEAYLLTVEFKVNLMSPARGQYFIAEGKVVKAGRNITVAEGWLYVRDKGQDKPVAMMVATLMTLHPEGGFAPS